MMGIKEKLEEFYLSKSESIKDCLLTLRSIILQKDDEMVETMKYSMPCFCLGKRIICYLWTDKKTREPYILFVQGMRLNHPLLEKGSRSKMKILRINPNKDIALGVIDEILSKAISIA